MKDSIFHNADLITPAYVYEQAKILDVLEILGAIREQTNCFPIYSIKSANMIGLLELIKPYVSGFSCSSLFEVKLAKEILDDDQTVHITTPGYKENELDEILELSDFITLNSSTQLNKYSEKINNIASCGIRINPELSFVEDERYDPCRTQSKLGISLKKIEKIEWNSVEGIHIHNNCESINFDELKQSIQHVMLDIPKDQSNLKWINLGGGYLLDDKTDLTPLVESINWLHDNYDVDVYFEPGKAVTGHAGKLLATVIDLFESDGKQVAILDTTVNHLPEVFEYQYQPVVMNTFVNGDYKYCLAGSSCLSGDLFGDYFFDEPLGVGDRIVFENIGAYMQVKANMFNGINLPVTYLLDEGHNFRLLKQHDYESFRSRL
jgi:carboxynorspermidine decarboxylase